MDDDPFPRRVGWLIALGFVAALMMLGGIAVYDHVAYPDPVDVVVPAR